MNPIRALPLALSAALAAAYSQSVTSVTTVATFNNIGIEIGLSGASDTAAAVSVAWNPAVSQQAPHPGHGLSRVAANRFAGSVFGLRPNTAYMIRLLGKSFPLDTLFQVTTRSDSFPAPKGATYHVAVNGSDSHDGSSLSQAFATLAHAVSLANPGATILLHVGRYCESVTLPRSGTAQAPICIRNAPGEAAALDGRDTSFHPTWSSYDAGAGVYRSACTAQPGLAYRNGKHLFAHPSLKDLVGNTWGMEEGFFADGAYLYVRFPAGRAPTAADTVQIPRFTTALTFSGRDYIQVRGLEIAYYGLDSYPRGIYCDGASYNLVDSCFFHHSVVGVALKRGCRFNTVQRCEFTETPIDTWNWSAVKEGTDYYEAGGVVVYGSPTANIGNVIRNNHFSHLFDGSHLYSDDASGPTSNLDFHGNLLEFLNDDGIETDGAGTNVRIYGNVFRKFLTGISVAPAQGGPTYIMRNLLTGWETHSGYVGYPVKFNVDGSMTTDWVYLYHNTCQTSVAGQPGFWFKQYSAWNHIVSRNNVYAGTDYALQSGSSQNPVDFDSDDLFTTATGKVAQWSGSNFASLSAFSKATGQEAHGLNADPEFAAVGTDYRLAAGSPLIDGGAIIPGVNDDFIGKAPDIGAYEYDAQAEIRRGRKTAAGPERMPVITITRSLPGGATLRFDCGALADPKATLSLYAFSGRRLGLYRLRAGINRIPVRIGPGNAGLGLAVLERDGKRFTSPILPLP
ncbi:MAG: right-handed parallel beta-helix repeat-containing protein [Fibrobacteres bacterium]|nr:right-handed parallel beta-helix repeat-containing protein [Fibrobacterota bacterium]